MKKMVGSLVLLVTVGVVMAQTVPRLASQPTRAQAATPSTDRMSLASEAPVYLAQSAQCSQRVGPFATQDTAWARWRQAQGGGYAVSGGVFPCYDASSTRGYCFNVFVC